MSTINQLVSRIKRRLTRTNDTAIEASIIDELVAAQEDLEDEAMLPAFLGGNEFTLAAPLTGATADLKALVVGFLRLDYQAGKAVFYQDTTQDEQWVAIKRYDDREQLKQTFPGALVAGGFPLGYHMNDGVIELRPTPTVSVPATIRVRYYKSDPTTPVAGATTLWSSRAPTLLMATAGVEIAKYLRDDAALQYFGQKLGQARVKLVRRDQADEDSDQEYVMGDPD